VQIVSRYPLLDARALSAIVHRDPRTFSAAANRSRRSSRILKSSGLLEFDSQHNEAGLIVRSSYALGRRFFLSFSLARARATRRLSAAANKKGRKVIEKVEQPRSPACTCRGACRLYRRARPRDGYEHLDMFSRRVIPIALSTKRHPSSFSLFEHCFSIRGAVSGSMRDRFSLLGCSQKSLFH
jgi:hypothetical protein